MASKNVFDEAVKITLPDFYPWEHLSYALCDKIGSVQRALLHADWWSSRETLLPLRHKLLNWALASPQNTILTWKKKKTDKHYNCSKLGIWQVCSQKLSDYLHIANDKFLDLKQKLEFWSCHLYPSVTHLSSVMLKSVKIPCTSVGSFTHSWFYHDKQWFIESCRSSGCWQISWHSIKTLQ